MVLRRRNEYRKGSFGNSRSKEVIVRFPTKVLERGLHILVYDTNIKGYKFIDMVHL